MVLLLVPHSVSLLVLQLVRRLGRLLGSQSVPRSGMPLDLQWA